jgi:hypothetical protein
MKLGLSPRKKHYVVVYEVISLDVWGNARDGFEVNDMHRAGTVEVPYTAQYGTGAWPTDAAIVKGLKGAGFLKPRIHTKSIVIDGEADGMLFLEEARNGRPIYHLRYVSGLHGSGAEKGKAPKNEYGAFAMMQAVAKNRSNSPQRARKNAQRLPALKSIKVRDAGPGWGQLRYEAKSGNMHAHARTKKEAVHKLRRARRRGTFYSAGGLLLAKSPKKGSAAAKAWGKKMLAYRKPAKPKKRKCYSGTGPQKRRVLSRAKRCKPRGGGA